MQAIRVAVQDLVDSYHVQVDTRQNAIWLLSRLSHCFVFKSADDLQHPADGVACSFEVPAQPWLPFSRLKELLAGIPRVSLADNPPGGAASAVT